MSSASHAVFATVKGYAHHAHVQSTAPHFRHRRQPRAWVSHRLLPAVCLYLCEVQSQWITDFPAILGTMTETHSCLQSITVSDPVAIQDDMALAAV